jgi:hypothetical protein
MQSCVPPFGNGTRTAGGIEYELGTVGHIGTHGATLRVLAVFPACGHYGRGIRERDLYECLSLQVGKLVASLRGNVRGIKRMDCSSPLSKVKLLLIVVGIQEGEEELP